MKKRDERGFTLIEMLLVMVIMGIMLAVIVPRAWRANVDSKYTLCRQNCTELAKYAQEWCESMLLAQSEDSTSAIDDYYLSLKRKQAIGTAYCAPIALSGSYTDNWNDTNGQLLVTGRVHIGGATALPEACVESVMPQDKRMRNPFNGADVFASQNDYYAVGTAVTGAIGYTGGLDGTYQYYSLLFQGTDNTIGGSAAISSNDGYHAGMGPNGIGAIRNGVFVARIR